MPIFSRNKPSGIRIKTVFRAFQMSIRARGRLSLAVSLFGFLMAFLPAAISVAFRAFTDSVQDLYGQGIHKMDGAMTLFFVLACLYLIQAVFEHIQSYYSSVDTLRIQAYMKEHIIRIGCRVQYRYIENDEAFQDKIAFVNSVSGKRVAGSLGGMIRWLQNLIRFFTLMAVLAGLKPWIVVVLLAASLPAAWLSYLQKDENYLRNMKWMKEGAWILQHFYDSCAQYSLNEVRYFGIFDFLKSKWKKSVEDYTRIKNRMTEKHVLYNGAADLLRSGVLVLVLLLVTKEIFDHPEVGLGAFTLVLTAAEQFQKVTARLFSDAAQLWEDFSYIQDYFALDDMDMDLCDDDQTMESGEITFQNVSFSYPGASSPVLKDLNVVIHDGEKVAIVGENGSGKSTFISLMCGMFEPERGQILVDGKRVADHLGMVRKAISVIFQNFVRYEDTIRNNITISDEKRQDDEDKLNHLMEILNLKEFVESQPGKLDEVIGSFHEKGNNLSGGQWQKLALARAAYRSDTKIMILDEPTSALDPLTEAELYRRFSELTENKTTIFVSHRLGVTAVVDRILVFHDGRIVEDGTHRELMEKQGYYAAMYQAQAEWYR